MRAAEERLEHLAGTVGPAVLGYLARRVLPREDAADVYQQVLVITWQKITVVPRDDRESLATAAREPDPGAASAAPAARKRMERVRAGLREPATAYSKTR